MTRLQLLTATIALLAITAAGGLVHGRLSSRWGGSDISREAAQKLDTLPDRFGGGRWRRIEQRELDEIELHMLRPYGYNEGLYVNRETGAQITCFVLVGPAGETAVHNPEICYSSRNYSTVAEKEPTVIDTAGTLQDKLWSMTFRENSVAGTLLRVYYGWSDGKRWEAVDNGRYKYAGLPHLYKIELAAVLPPDINLDEDDPCREFLEDFLPVLRECMVTAQRRDLLPW